MSYFNPFSSGSASDSNGSTPYTSMDEYAHVIPEGQATSHAPRYPNLSSFQQYQLMNMKKMQDLRMQFIQEPGCDEPSLPSNMQYGAYSHTSTSNNHSHGVNASSSKDRVFSSNSSINESARNSHAQSEGISPELQRAYESIYVNVPTDLAVGNRGFARFAIFTMLISLGLLSYSALTHEYWTGQLTFINSEEVINIDMGLLEGCVRVYEKSTVDDLGCGTVDWIKDVAPISPTGMKLVNAMRIMMLASISLCVQAIVFSVPSALGKRIGGRALVRLAALLVMMAVLLVAAALCTGPVAHRALSDTGYQLPGSDSSSATTHAQWDYGSAYYLSLCSVATSFYAFILLLYRTLITDSE